ncbi:UNVERIFIED_ORG: hypothetical protein GGE64_001362 [Rhizobium etli]
MTNPATIERLKAALAKLDAADPTPICSTFPRHASPLTIIECCAQRRMNLWTKNAGA